MCVCVCIYILSVPRGHGEMRDIGRARVCVCLCARVWLWCRVGLERLFAATCTVGRAGRWGFSERKREKEKVCVWECVCVRRCVCTWESNSEAGTIKERPTRSPSLTQLRVVSLSRRPRRPPPPPSPRPGRVAAYTRLSNVTPCSLHPGARSGANRERGIAEISRNFTSRVEFARNRA